MAQSKGKKKTSGNFFIRRRTPTPKMKREELKRLVEEATVDANGESEQLTGLYTMLEDYLQLPFETELLGIPVMVEKVERTDAEELVAHCRKGNKRQRVSILELPLPEPLPKGSEWIEAYRYWKTGKVKP